MVLVSPADSAFGLLSCPPSPDRARRALFPGGEGGDQSYFMQGASPLASPKRLNPGDTGAGGVSRTRGGVSLASPAEPAAPASKGGRGDFGCLPTPPLACFSAPYPPTPFPSGEGGAPKFIFAGGFAPGTPALTACGTYRPCQAGTPPGGGFFQRGFPPPRRVYGSLRHAKAPAPAFWQVPGLLWRQ